MRFSKQELIKVFLFSVFNFLLFINCSQDRVENDNPLIGTWKFISIGGMNSEGQKFLPYGDNPYGRLIYDANGNMCVLLMKRGRSKFQSNDIAISTCEELRSAFIGFDAYSGEYTIDTIRGAVTHKIEAARFPNWENTNQIRNYLFRNDTLFLSAEVKFGGDVWNLKAVLIDM